MSGIINQVGARSGIISSGSGTSAGTVTLSGVTGLDYEEGEWTPSTGGGLTSVGAVGEYTKIGKVIHLTFRNVTNATSSSGAGAYYANLPFTPGASARGVSFGGMADGSPTQAAIGVTMASDAKIYFTATISSDTDWGGSITYAID